MFNAWTLARNHNCILRQGCPSYVDGNIYFPNQDSMLYSETQFSVGLLTLPLRLVSDNPLFFHNVWLVAGFFLNGWFMYLLAKRLSRGNEPYSVLAGLIFMLAPHKMIYAGHMQLIAIFYLPLALLLIIRFLDTKKLRYTIGLCIALTLFFYSSWYLMVFALAGLGAMLLGLLLTKICRPKELVPIILAIVFSIIATLPLAKEYMRFSKQNDASFSVADQAYYASSVADYFIPYQGTLSGMMYDTIAPPNARRIPYSADGNSYHGIFLYAIAALILGAILLKKRIKISKPLRSWILVWAAVGVTGLVMSLGPMLKVGGSHIYGSLDDGTGLAMPLPYMLLDFAFPQIMFIRAVERWGVLVLLALCIMIAYLPAMIVKYKPLNKRRGLVFGLLVAFSVFELMPTHLAYMSSSSRSYELQIPEVYKYIKSQPEIDNILILTSDTTYPEAGEPFVRTEWVLWAGFHNRNIFNGYSGFEPKGYQADMLEFRSLNPASIEKMKMYDLRYVLVDKDLTRADPQIVERARQKFGKTIYKDDRYELFKI